MPSRSYRRCTAILIAAVTFSLALPLAAQASSADEPALPDLDTSASLEPRDGISSRFRPSATTTRDAARTQTSDITPLAAAVPAQVSGLVARERMSTSARITWSAPADNGSPVTGYHLQLLQNGTVIDEAVWSSPALGVTVLDLSPDSTYTFRVAAVNAQGTGAFSIPLEFTTTHSSVQRVFGADRYETAVAVSADAFPSAGITAAFVANGRNFPDALALAAAAGALDGPVLLTPAASLPASTSREIAALQPGWAFVAGGPAVVSDNVINQLRPSTTEGAYRVGGKNRYATAAAISGFWDSAPPRTVYLASGTNFPDALAGAAAAGFVDAPILLTTRDVLPADTVAALKQLHPARIVALGGSGSVSDAVLKRARLSTGVTTTTSRLGGSTRYDTAVSVSKATFTKARVPVVYVASGLNFADGLTGAAAGGSLGGPVLLTRPAEMPAAVLAEIDRLDPVRVVVLGGPAVVSDRVFSQIATVLDD